MVRRRRIPRLQSLMITASVLALTIQVDSQQMTLRIRGNVTSEAGTPISGAEVKAEALLGLRGSQFVGQREFSQRTDKNGRCGLLGIIRGSWVFEASAAGYFPHVVCIPIEMMEARIAPAAPWELSMELQRVDDVISAEHAAKPWARLLRDAAMHFAEGRRAQAAGTAARLLEEGSTPEAMCAAGDFMLTARDVHTALKFFERALDLRPDWDRPYLGIGSAAMYGGDYDTAVTAFFTARRLTRNADLQRTLSAALRDLHQIAKMSDPPRN